MISCQVLFDFCIGHTGLVEELWVLAGTPCPSSCSMNGKIPAMEDGVLFGTWWGSSLAEAHSHSYHWPS